MSKMQVDGLDSSGVRTIDVPDFPSNSNKAKKKVRPVANAVPKSTPRSVLSDIFNGSLPEARKQIWNEQIKPGLIDMGANAVYTLVDYIFYHGSRGGYRRRSGRTDYAGASRRSKTSHDDEYGENDRPVRKKWNQVVVTGNTMPQAREKADIVWNELEDCLEENGSITVGDLFSAVEWPTVYTDFDYGWKSLDGCRTVADGDGYWFDMTKPVRLEN